MILYAIIHASLMFLGYGIWCFCMHEDPPEEDQTGTAIICLLGVIILPVVFTPLLFVTMLAVLRTIGFRLKP